MKKILLFCLLSIIAIQGSFAQVAGDTIVVSTFNYTQTYGSGNRDTMINFPNLPGVNYEKIYMTYNMRCKGGVVGNQVPPSGTAGCGEWDYSCNTYITDSTKVDSTLAQQASHIIPGFSGTSYSYTSVPTYTYYQYNQQSVVNTSTVSETSATVGTATNVSSSPFNTHYKASKSQYLWTASELTNAGLVAGNISSIRLNINNSGASASFLRVRMKHTTSTVLNAGTPDLTGFTDVYFLNTTLTAGINQLNFYNNFNWNGTDNILVEFSFSNPGGGTDNMVASELTTSISGLITTANDYSVEFTGASQMNLGNGNFSNFTDQISISFWAYGNPANLPTNTSAVYATDAASNRQVNVHFPWTNSNIYWDCGSGGTYDRINKLATTSEFEGQWNHWTFTKNSTTGIMNIYLNGTSWFSGSGKTIPIQITNMMLGAGPNMTNPYFGKIDDYSLWNVELSQATIQAWMYKTLNISHPNYSNLVSYYKFNEGTGNTSLDASSASATATSTGLTNWRIPKGFDLFKNFTETLNRPIATFVQGVYTQTITPIVVMDSVLNNMNTVYAFSSNGSVISPIDTNYYFQAGYTYVYDGSTGSLIDSVNNASQGVISITQLNYYTFSPSRFQIMSFVTPYGNGLDLGPNGKTWTFDVTDYGPILKGWKRMTMDAGGQWQEDMDIKFIFIVGTPPKNVKDINNIWKVESTSYTNIVNDAKYEPRSILMDPTATSFKVKTAITGHGQEGEFIPRTHFINVNGGSPEFSWDVWKECADNPIYPQGGTWIYDRAGWCPGAPTDMKESEITPYVTPGSVATLDYGLTAASGTSNYWVSNQLVSYGAPNFTLDAAVVDVKNPSKKVEYARTNSICNRPIVVIKNTGSTTLTSLTIDYWVNSNATKDSYTWNGSLGFLETAEVELPATGNLWKSLNGALDNVFHVEIKSPNGGADSYSFNNKFNSEFDITNVVPSNFIVRVTTNLAGSETQYQITDENGNQVLSRNNLSASTTYRDTMQLPFGCYQFKITDAGDDGVDFWNNNDGVGLIRFTKANGASLKTFDGDFGKYFIYNFTIDYPLSYDELESSNDIKVYPNPASKQFVLEGKYIDMNSIHVYNQLGQDVHLPIKREANKYQFDSSHLQMGMYYVLFSDENGRSFSKKVVIE
jgi:hypothetical protein